MSAHTDPSDALLRYDFARDNLAAVDRELQSAHLKNRVRVTGELADSRRHEIVDSLHELAQLSEKFAQSARELADALAGSG